MKKATNDIKVPAKMTAKAAKSSTETVLKVRAGKRQNGPVAKRILKADQMLEQGITNLIEEIKSSVNK